MLESQIQVGMSVKFDVHRGKRTHVESGIVVETFGQDVLVERRIFVFMADGSTKEGSVRVLVPLNMIHPHQPVHQPN